MKIDHVPLFFSLKDRLADKYPCVLSEADSLAESIVDPRSATADEVWSILWDKPLYANVKVEIALQWIKTLREGAIPDWHIMGSGTETFLIVKPRRGIKRDDFEVHGPLAQNLVARSTCALHRLYAIQGAAIALRERAALSEAPFADLVETKLADIVPQLRKEFGAWWGAVTVLHALTDLGLAVKPDRQLIRSVQALGFCPNVSNVSSPSLRDTIEINAAVRSLLGDIGWPQTPQNLRRLDKILMEISRYGLLSTAMTRASRPVEAETKLDGRRRWR